MLGYNFVEEQQWYYLSHGWGDKKVYPIQTSISPKVNVILRFKILKSVAQFTYLGRNISSTENDVSIGIAKAWIIMGMQPII